MVLQKDLDRLGQPQEYATARKAWPEFINATMAQVQQLVDSIAAGQVGLV